MKHPMQSIDKHRFVENKLVTWLIDQLPGGMNSLSIESQEGEYDDADYDQILQLIGYSVSGIPYRNHALYEITDEIAKTGATPDKIYEDLYNELKNSLRPIVSDLFNKAEEDLH